MKCIRNPTTGEILRLTEFAAKQKVRLGWTYVSKGEWKRAVRPDISKTKEIARRIAAGIRRI